MLIIGLFFLLFTSFTIHIIIVIFYVLNRSKLLFNLFVVTAFTNISFGMVLSIYALNNPESIRDLDFGFILWILSGFVMIIMVILKTAFFRRIYLRTKDPDYFHYNYFGKKVLNKGIVKQYEYFTLLLSMPFFLLLGAYFIARLINYIMYSHI